MAKKSLSRRDFLRAAGMVAGGAVLAACTTTTPTPETITVKETVVVEGEAQVVKETVVVEGETVEKVITATPAAREPVSITWWQAPIWRYAPDNETILGAGSAAKGFDLIERFQEKEPWVTVTMELIPWDQWNQKITTGFASGDVGNVMYSVANAGRTAAGLLDPVDDYLTEDMLSNWLPGLQQSVTVGGRIYCIPMFVNPWFTTFSQTALEKYGCGDLITEVGPDRDGVTFELMLKYGAMFRDKASRYFLGVPCDHGSILYWMFGSWLEAWGVKSWDDAEEKWIVAENPAAVDAFDWLVNAAKDGILPPGSSLPKWSDIDNFFYAENLAARFQWPGMQTELEVAQEAGQASADFKLFYAAFPHATADKARATGMYPISYSVGRTKDPNAREASFKFANFMASDTSNAAGILTEGVFPCYNDSIAALADHPKMEDENIKWILEKHVKFEPEIINGNHQPMTNARSSRIFFELDPYNYFIQQFQSLMLGQKDSKGMLDEIAAYINGALGAK